MVDFAKFEWEAQQREIARQQAEKARQLEILRKYNPERFTAETGQPAQRGMGPRDTGDPLADDWGVGVSPKKLQDLYDEKVKGNSTQASQADARRKYFEFDPIFNPAVPFGPQPLQQKPLSGVNGSNNTRPFDYRNAPVTPFVPGTGVTWGTDFKTSRQLNPLPQHGPTQNPSSRPNADFVDPWYGRARNTGERSEARKSGGWPSGSGQSIPQQAWQREQQRLEDERQMQRNRINPVSQSGDQSLDRRIGDIQRGNAREVNDYGPQKEDDLPGWNKRNSIRNEKDDYRRAAIERENKRPATRDLGLYDPRRIDRAGDRKITGDFGDNASGSFPGGRREKPGEPLSNLDKARQANREANRERMRLEDETLKFQKQHDRKGKPAGGNWVAEPFTDERRVRDEISRLQKKQQAERLQGSPERSRHELNRYKAASSKGNQDAKGNYYKFSDDFKLEEAIRRYKENNRMPNTVQEVMGGNPTIRRDSSAKSNIKPFASSSAGSRDRISRPGNNGPLPGFENGNGMDGRGRWNKPKPAKPNGGDGGGGGGIDWEAIRRKANPKTITGIMGGKDAPGQNRGPVATIERPSGSNVLAPKVAGNPVVSKPFGGNISRNFVRGVGAAGGAADLIGQGLAWKGAIDHVSKERALKDALKKELGLTDADLLKIGKEYRPKFKDGEWAGNNGDWDVFGPGGLADAARARRRGMSPERYQRERFGPQTRQDFDKARKDARDAPYKKAPFKPTDWEGDRKRFQKKLNDMFNTDKSPEWKPGEKEANRKKWANYDPLDPKNNVGRVFPNLPFNPLPPGSPGGPIRTRPQIIGWEVDYFIKAQYTSEKSGGHYTYYIRSVFYGNGGGPMENAPNIQGDYLIHVDGYQERYYSSKTIETFGIGLPDYTSGGAMLEPREEQYYKDKWGEQWGWSYFDTRWYAYPNSVFAEKYKDHLRFLSYGKFEIQNKYGRATIVSSKPIFAGEPNPRRIAPPVRPKQPLPGDEEDNMPCKYAEDNEVSADLKFFNKLTKKIESRKFQVHQGANEAFEFLSAQVAGLSKSLSDLSDVLEVEKYKQPAGKILTPVVTTEAYQTIMAAAPIAVVPLVKTLQGEMGVLAAMNHMLSGHHLLGKIQLPVNPMDSTAGKIAPKTSIGMMLNMHNATTGMIGVPSQMSTISTDAQGTLESKSTPFKNATDAIENVNGSVQGMAVDMSAVMEMLFKVLQNQEMLVNMVVKETYKTDVLIKDAGCRTTEISIERPGVLKHGKVKEGDANTFKWDSVFGVGKSFTTVPIWKDELDKNQLGLKTNMQAQIAASSVFFPISAKDNTVMPSLKTRGAKGGDDWKRFVKTVNSGSEGGVYHGPGMPESLIQEIANGVAKNIDTSTEPFLGGGTSD